MKSINDWSMIGPIPRALHKAFPFGERLSWSTINQIKATEYVQLEFINAAFMALLSKY